MKKLLHEIFIDGLSGMATGLFATLIIGTIIVQISTLIPAPMGSYIFLCGKLAMALTGAGIGVGVASRLKSSPMVLVSAIAAGMIGAYASKISAAVNAGDLTSFFDANTTHLISVGEPLGSFLAVLTAVYIGKLVSGKTPVDILVTPLCCIGCGGAVGLIIGPPISGLMAKLGELINWGTEQAPFTMGIVVSVLVGIALTLPISSAAICASFGLVGLAGGAAVAGCCAQMVGFAVMSYKENKVGGLISQGIGTSMLQMPNIVKNPKIWIAPTLASAITGPIATCVFGLQMNGAAINSGMGTCGLCGPIGVITGWFSPSDAAVAKDLVALAPSAKDWIGLALVCVVLPAILSFIFCEVERKIGWIKENDLKLPE